MFPIGTVGRTTYRPYATFTLILINLLVFCYQLTVFIAGEAAVTEFFMAYALGVCHLGAEPALLSVRNGFFSMFLHGSIPHVLFNMVFLWIFGPRVEAYFGSRAFTIFYIGVGFAATTAHILFGGTVCDPTMPNGAGIVIGASGAIAGVMGAFLFLHPMAKIRTALIFMRIPFGIVNVYAFVYLLVWVLMDIIQLFNTQQSSVAHWAHIGGFVAGFGALFLLTMFKSAPKPDAFEYLDD